MANVSKANVTITHNLGEALEEYILSEEESYYPLLLTDFESSTENGITTITGTSFGRWHYGNNIENYLLSSPNNPPQASQNRPEWQKLSEALAKPGAFIKFHVVDAEPGLDFIEEYEVLVEGELGGTTIDTTIIENMNYTLENLAYYRPGATEEELFEEYAALPYEVFLEENEKGKLSYAEIEDWIENYIVNGPVE